MPGRHDSLVRSVVGWGRLTGGALVLVALVLAGLFVAERTVYQPRLERSIDATRVVRLAHEAMLDQDRGLRGYLLAGDPEFLEAYERGRGDLPPLNEDAARLLGGDDELGALLLEMRVAQQAWVDDWAVEARRRGGTGDIDTAFVREGKARFDAYLAHYEALTAALVANRTAAVDDAQRAVLVAVAAAFVVLIVGGLLGARRGRALREAVGPPLEALLGRLASIRRGDLAPQQILEGPAELRTIGAGLEATAAALAAARATAAERAAQLESRGRRQAEVLALAREVSGSLSLRYVLRGVSVHASAVADGARVLVWLIDRERTVLESVADTTGPDLRPTGVDAVPLGDGAVGRAGQHGRAGRDGDSLAIPMVVGAEVIGVLEFRGRQVAGLDADAIELLETIAVHAAAAIGAARLHEATAELAMTDALTTLPNRRRLEQDLRVELMAATRYGRPLGLLMIDVDHFKAYNDTFGHQAGDAALQTVARVLGGDLRGSDVAYRYGGEEFVVILRETARADAAALAERVRSAVEHHFAAPSELRPITISVGVAGLPDNGPTAELLTRAADEALYEAKGSGRNRSSSPAIRSARGRRT